MTTKDETAVTREEAKHTPGPWVVSYQWDDGHGVLLSTIRRYSERLGTGSVVVEMKQHVLFRSFPELVANDNLIAAAPDLLEALKRAERFILNGIEYGYIAMPDAGDPAHDTLPIIQHAITKATRGDS